MALDIHRLQMVKSRDYENCCSCPKRFPYVGHSTGWDSLRGGIYVSKCCLCERRSIWTIWAIFSFHRKCL